MSPNKRTVLDKEDINSSHLSPITVTPVVLNHCLRVGVKERKPSSLSESTTMPHNLDTNIKSTSCDEKSLANSEGRNQDQNQNRLSSSLASTSEEVKVRSYSFCFELRSDKFSNNTYDDLVHHDIFYYFSIFIRHMMTQ